MDTKTSELSRRAAPNEPLASPPGIGSIWRAPNHSETYFPTYEQHQYQTTAAIPIAVPIPSWQSNVAPLVSSPDKLYARTMNRRRDARLAKAEIMKRERAARLANARIINRQRVTRLVSAIRGLRQRHYFIFYKNHLQEMAPNLFIKYHSTVQGAMSLYHLQCSGIAHSWSHFNEELWIEDCAYDMYTHSYMRARMNRPCRARTILLNIACRELNFDYANVRKLIDQYAIDLQQQQQPLISTYPRTSSKQLRSPFDAFIAEHDFEPLGAHLSVDIKELEFVFPGQDRWDVFTCLHGLMNANFAKLLPTDSVATQAGIDLGFKLMEDDENEADAALKLRAVEEEEVEEGWDSSDSLGCDEFEEGKEEMAAIIGHAYEKNIRTWGGRDSDEEMKRCIRAMIYL
ncbi:MAG: hypothetical protein Q9220_000938 [cf. Caloplaca sp. 1 TL-2023]